MRAAEQKKREMAEARQRLYEIENRKKMTARRN
jgi:hypothetical protein